MTLKDKRVLIGVTGGIAAYKVLDVISGLRQRGCQIQVIMTKNATKLVSTHAFRTMSGNPVMTELFSDVNRWNVGHIEAARWADLVLVAPATANVIGKVACGIGDDLLSTTIIATRSPVVFSPAMNTAMWQHPIVQSNIEKLKKLGYLFIEPEEGHLACGTKGMGRFPDPARIIKYIEDYFSGGDLAGVTVLVTAGPTREYFDPVRFISNPSSGKMGYAVAEAARDMGARVVLVSGPVSIPEPDGVRVIRVTTALEMYQAVLAEFPDADIVIKAAAVCDYRPEARLDQKMKKGRDPISIRLEPNPDILKELGTKKGSKILVGFAAETQELEAHAMEKLVSKNLDMIVVNDVTQEQAGFSSDTNIVKFVYPDGRIEELPLLPKSRVAREVLLRVADMWRAKTNR